MISAIRSAASDVLVLRLEGPLQAWGERGRWTVRDTRLEPTKSGVVGLLAACLGWGVEADQAIADLATALRLGVRADRPGTVLRDFHTVLPGTIGTASPVQVAASVVSERFYLSDACFLVALEGSGPVLDQLEAAVRRPVWPPYLGRKSCVPAAPIYPALPGHPSRLPGQTLEAALAAFPWIGGDGQPPARLRAVIELPPGAPPQQGLVQRRRDVPLSFVTRRFAAREVRETFIAPPGEY